MSLRDDVARRRTFAIISHPDAGKTTLTEKLLLFGGAIQLAGAVKARGQLRRSHADWMKVERERGITVSASVMTFEYSGATFNLLDTPGHEDFSEDTYRTLSAVDSAVMVLDAAKGIETQTRKLFEVCRLRDIPITTFINKLDREGQDPFGLLDEIEHTLALEVTPASWPIGMGRDFLGCYDLLADRLILINTQRHDVAGIEETVEGLNDPRLDELLPEDAVAKLREEVEMVQGLCPPFDVAAYLEGNLTPVYFGSALRNFGVKDLLDGLTKHAPPPQPQPSEERLVDPLEENVSAFVFKIQANMDPKHRDRIAFVRLCSGRFVRGMKMFHVRSGKTFAVHNPQLFLARERERAEAASPGDILGIPNHGNLRIGDALTEGETIHFTGIPSFAPALLRRIRPEDPMRAKHLSKALLQLAEEGAAQVFRSRTGSNWIIGVAGALQFEVLADRIRTEYNIGALFESMQISLARWVEADDLQVMKRFINANESEIAEDHNDAPVYLARSQFILDRTQQEWPDVRFLKTVEQVQ
jgi:peptide chain release factor 3